MGCCGSREVGTHPPYPANNPHTTENPESSSRNITATSPPQPASLQSHNGTPRASRTHVSSQPAARSPPARAPNVPLRALNPDRKCKMTDELMNSTSRNKRSDGRWTKVGIEREREDFWNTRVTGQSEIWQTIRTIITLLQSGDVNEAQAILDASDCTCPTGEIWNLFDARGAWYKIPEWMVMYPKGLVDVDGGYEEDDGKSGIITEDDSEEAPLKVEKGKGKEVDTGPKVPVRFRLSDGSDIVLKVGQQETVGSMLQRVREAKEISPKVQLRLYYLGKPIQPQTTPSDFGYKEGYVLSVGVFDLS